MAREPLLNMSPTKRDVAEGEAGILLSGAKARLGFLLNMSIYMANLAGVLAGYLSTTRRSGRRRDSPRPSRKPCSSP